jgi:hypothetical protein
VQALLCQHVLSTRHTTMPVNMFGSNFDLPYHYARATMMLCQPLGKQAMFVGKQFNTCSCWDTFEKHGLPVHAVACLLHGLSGF